MKSNFLKPAITSGCIFALLMISESIYLSNQDINVFEHVTLGFIINLLRYVILPLAFIAITLYVFKKKYNNGYLSFSETLKTGTATLVITGLIYGIYNFTYNSLNPEYVEKSISQMYEFKMHQYNLAISQGATPEELPSAEEIKKQIDAQKEGMTSFFTIPTTIIIYSLFGIIGSLILSPFFRKDKPLES